MKVQPIQKNDFVHMKKNPSFSSYSSRIYKNGALAYKTETGFFRGDLNWEKFLNYILYKYANTNEKVNIVNHACSAGYETYSLLLMLMEKISKHDYQKFFPIIARDIDTEALKYAQQGIFHVGSHELELLSRYGGDTFANNFQVDDMKNSGTVPWYNQYQITCNNDLKQYIDFAQSDILDDKELLKKDNTILLCRNFWPYMDAKKCLELMDFLKHNMGKNSLVVIGRFDCDYEINLLLEAKGFKDITGLEHRVFKAPEK